MFWETEIIILNFYWTLTCDIGTMFADLHFSSNKIKSEEGILFPWDRALLCSLRWPQTHHFPA
jgi:hypothetical protein